MSKLSRSARWHAYILLLTNVVFWGATLPLVKPALSFVTPVRMLSYRFLLASILMTPVIWRLWQEIKQPHTYLARIIVLEFLGGTVSLTLLYSGLARLGAIESSLIASTTPLFTVLIGIFILREKQETHEWVGLALAMLGTFLITLFPILSGITPWSSFSVVGTLCILGQNIATAFYFVMAKSAYQKLPKLFVTGIGFYVCMLTLIPVAIAEAIWGSAGHDWRQVLTQTITQDLQHWQVWLSIIYLAIFTSIIGLTVYIKGQQIIEVSEASVFGYLQPLIYMPLAIALLGEKVSLFELAGLGLVLMGVFIAEKRFKKSSTAKVVVPSEGVTKAAKSAKERHRSSSKR